MTPSPAHSIGTADGGTFKNPWVAGSGKALNANGATVKGCVFLSNGFRAEGEVLLLGAQIEGDLDCEGGAFTELTGTKASINGSFSWRKVVEPESAKVNLINASVGSILDDEASWPAPGNLSLDGFVYGLISAGPRDAQTRLRWLERQNGFSLQPYLQLARVLRGTGDDRGARHVLYEMEHRRRAREGRGWPTHVWGFVLRCTIGYGYYPGRALWGLVALTALSGMLFWRGYAAGTIAPTDKDAYQSFAASGQLPAHYENFSPFVYSLENSFPLVKLGQAERWQPDPNPQRPACPPLKSVSGLRCRAVSPGFLRCFRWVQICLGWILATLFVAGVTGIVRKE